MKQKSFAFAKYRGLLLGHRNALQAIRYEFDSHSLHCYFTKYLKEYYNYRAYEGRA
jgi:hypothetical protein